MCHKGHDVGYSRKSSFFCDCGAESATAVEQNRTQCQCLSPLSDDRIQALYEETPESEDSEPAQVPTYPNKFTQYTIENFPTECKQSLLKLVEDAKRSKWDEILLLLFTRYQTNAHASSISFTSLLGDKPSGSTICTEGPNLISRSAVPLNLEHHTGASFLPIRAAKANALQLRMISDSTNHIRKNRPNPSLNTQLIASDDRGRLIIAESTSVLFCSAIPHVNTREYPGIPAVSHLSRSQLNILGSDRVKFQIFGMTICPENNRHVLFWGASEACVAIVSSSFDSFEQIIYLTLQLEPTECESEYLLKCEWMPESELMVVAICGTVVHVFDLKRIENSCCKATTHYALAYEDVLIRSAAMTGCLSRGEGDDETFCGIRAKLALLLDTGRMHFIELAVDEDGDLEDQGENYIECGAGASFPSAGIRRYNGGSPMTRGSTTSTLGEGVFLTHLRQSNLLIYQCISSCCVAMLLDSDGAICGSFGMFLSLSVFVAS